MMNGVPDLWNLKMSSIFFKQRGDARYGRSKTGNSCIKSHIRPFVDDSCAWSELYFGLLDHVQPKYREVRGDVVLRHIQLSVNC